MSNEINLTNTGIEPLVVGVDVGNGYTKSVSFEFQSGCKNFGKEEPPTNDNVVFYNGNYYAVGLDHTIPRTDQKIDETHLVLALAAIAKELKSRGLHKRNIILSEGLPIGACNNHSKQNEVEYYKKGETIRYKFENEDYEVTIDDVYVNAQGLAGIVDLLSDKAIPDPCLIIDIGGFTVDIVVIENYVPAKDTIRSIHFGIKQLITDCKESLRPLLDNEDVRTSQLLSAIKGENTIFDDACMALIHNKMETYAKELAIQITEKGIGLKTLPCVIMGGGSNVIKDYGKKYFPLAQYITNTKANALGYETIAKSRLQAGK